MKTVVLTLKTEQACMEYAMKQRGVAPSGYTEFREYVESLKDYPEPVLVITDRGTVLGHTGTGTYQWCFLCLKGWTGCFARDGFEQLLKTEVSEILRTF